MAVVGEAVTVGENQMVVGTPVANEKGGVTAVSAPPSTSYVRPERLGVGGWKVGHGHRVEGGWLYLDVTSCYILMYNYVYIYKYIERVNILYIHIIIHITICNICCCS